MLGSPMERGPSFERTDSEDCEKTFVVEARKHL